MICFYKREPKIPLPSFNGNFCQIVWKFVSALLYIMTLDKSVDKRLRNIILKLSKLKLYFN